MNEQKMFDRSDYEKAEGEVTLMEKEKELTNKEWMEKHPEIIEEIGSLIASPKDFEKYLCSRFRNTDYELGKSRLAMIKGEQQNEAIALHEKYEEKIKKIEELRFSLIKAVVDLKRFKEAELGMSKNKEILENK